MERLDTASVEGVIDRSVSTGGSFRDAVIEDIRSSNRSTASSTAIPVATAMLMGLGLIGTGGQANAGLLIGPGSTGNQRVRYVGEMHQLSNQHIASTVDQLIAIRAVFGLSITDLAKVLNTSRPTVYQWLDGVQPRRSGRDAIARVDELVREWRGMTGLRLGAFADAQFEDGRSLLELIADEAISTDYIKSLFPALVTKVQAEQETKLASSPEARMKELGFAAPPKEASDLDNNGASFLVDETAD